MSDLDNLHDWLLLHFARVNAKQLPQITSYFGSISQAMAASQASWQSSQILTPKQLERLFDPGNDVLISEAVRGEGAVLINDKGERFIDELKPRDEVARAIFLQYKKGNRVFLDISPLKKRDIDFSNRFPSISSMLKSVGLEGENLIPVSPAAHYSIGGIEAEPTGKTSVEGIFSVGEVSCTGIHGANRLASNSLLECVVFGYKTD